MPFPRKGLKMKSIIYLSLLFILVSLVGCSFTSVSEDSLNNPMDPTCSYFVGYTEAAVIYARASEVGEPLALEEAAYRLEKEAVTLSGYTARNMKQTAYLLREQAKKIRDSWNPNEN